METLHTIADCLRQIGYHKMAEDVLKEKDQKTLETYARFIVNKAPVALKHVVGERLWAEGLIYEF